MTRKEKKVEGSLSKLDRVLLGNGNDHTYVTSVAQKSDNRKTEILVTTTISPLNGHFRIIDSCHYIISGIGNPPRPTVIGVLLLRRIYKVPV